MKRSFILLCTLTAALLAANAAFAQVIPPGGAQFNPLLPPPPPKIEPPVIPKMGVPIQQNYGPAPSTSFGDRITTCLDQAAAGGLGPAERGAYSRSCANR
jgi:hypothetical protein